MGLKCQRSNHWPSRHWMTALPPRPQPSSVHHVQIFCIWSSNHSVCGCLVEEIWAWITKSIHSLVTEDSGKVIYRSKRRPKLWKKIDEIFYLRRCLAWMTQLPTRRFFFFLSWGVCMHQSCRVLQPSGCTQDKQPGCLLQVAVLCLASPTRLQ